MVQIGLAAIESDRMDKNLRLLFKYDEESPSCLTRLVGWASGMNYKTIKARAGDYVVGTHTLRGITYYTVKVSNKTCRVHRIVWGLHYGKIPEGMQIDHIDGNPLNNKISNLRCVDNKTNARNQKFREGNTSGVCGVHYAVRSNKAGKKRYYWIAQWNGLDGKRCAKCFAVETYGNDLAFKLACEFLKNSIEALNQEGAGYHFMHGIRK